MTQQWPCARRAAIGGMIPDPHAGTELGYDGPMIADADPYTHWIYTHFCTFMPRQLHYQIGPGPRP